MSEARVLNCPRCGSALPASPLGLPALTHCAGCQAETQVAVFPALYRPVSTGQRPQLILEEGKAACFYHATKLATVPCDGCGRFLCALCDVELHGKHFCPACLEAGRDKGRVPALERARTRYDQIVCSLVIFSLVPPLFFLLPAVTAPCALGLGLWKWSAPPSQVARSRLYLVLGMLLALVELAGVVLFWRTVFWMKPHGHP